MNCKPTFFESIRLKASQRWDQLERDPELAGPWHQLFKQVQSPRHIVSELLQNADDAGATEASVRVEDHTFVFEHNGEDFTEDHFVSLCRFGYSNKRALHTIGFRGIGFKSTFSLGDRVELYTSSLAVCFHRRRFTEPEWLASRVDTGGLTRIRVEISNRLLQFEVQKNLEEWLKSPVSLLFFRSIRRIRVGDQEVRWKRLKPGPFLGSEWVALAGHEDQALLLLRSEAEAFPEEALAEIRQERLLDTDDGTAFPPCHVEIVLGTEGRLFVVLPTGVETELPFACNAPFIAKPDREDIKDPGISPTNRWLLERAGKLASSAMLQWLEQAEISLEERTRAYCLFPDVDRQNRSLNGVCGAIVEESFGNSIHGKAFLLTEDGKLAGEKGCAIIPQPVLDVWGATQTAALFDPQDRPPLCRHVQSTDRNKLLHWGVVDEIDKRAVLRVLQQKNPPKPKGWRELLTLWAFLAPEVTGFRRNFNAEDLRIIPVQGKEELYASSQVVRLGEKRLLQSDDDWDFLAKHLLVLNANWPRYLAEQRRIASERQDDNDGQSVEAAYELLDVIGLDDTSDVSDIIDQVGAEFFAQGSVSLAECVQLAQIAAKLDATVGSSFRYATLDRQLRAAEQGILVDFEDRLKELVPPARHDFQLLHQQYWQKFNSCSSEDWQKWIESGRAGLQTFIPLAQKQILFYGKRHIEHEAEKRGLKTNLNYHYVSENFEVEDWDFEEPYWQHWTALAESDERLWATLVEHIVAQRAAYWNRAERARLLQVANSRSKRSMTNSHVAPSWVIKLRALPCLTDTRGFPRRPDELLRRTPETEGLMDAEPFISGLLDREATRPLLDLLGVRSTPTGPDSLLDRLRALARAETPPAHEVEKWYRRLDQLMETCSTGDLQAIKEAFLQEKLTLTQDGDWATAAAVYLMADDEDVPGAAVIRASVGELALWRKIGVADRPTPELALAWLKTLPPSAALPVDEAQRVRALLARHPSRVWEECGHWLNLAGEWVPVEGLSYALSMHALIPWRHLHQWVKQRTADLQRLSAEEIRSRPFVDLAPLADRVEERFTARPFSVDRPIDKDWLQTLGRELCRVELDSPEETRRIRELAASLAESLWLETAEIETIPYIDGKPAGTPRKGDVLWLDDTIHVVRLSKAKLAKRVPEELGKAFRRPDIKSALDYGFERSPADVRDYIGENFKLSPIPTEEGDNSIPLQPLELPCSHTVVNAGNSAPCEAGPLVDSGYTLSEPVLADTASAPDTSPPCLPPGPNGSGDTVCDADLLVHDRHEMLPDEPAATLQASEEEAEIDDRGPRAEPKPAKPSLIEQFALSQGFRRASDTRYLRDDGSWIEKSSDSPFPWLLHDHTGDLRHAYLPLDWCMEREPKEIKAEVWGLLEQRPDRYALIAKRLDDSPTALTGAALIELRDAGKIILHPATYRLVHAP